MRRNEIDTLNIKKEKNQRYENTERRTDKEKIGQNDLKKDENNFVGNKVEKVNSENNKNKVNWQKYLLVAILIVSMTTIIIVIVVILKKKKLQAMSQDSIQINIT